jgi:uncharacterized protein (DUF362 family)
MDRAGIRDKVRSGATVFVKPNFTFPRPIPGVTTNHEVLESVLGVLKDRAARVLVGEGDGGYRSFTARDSLRNHGMPEMCKRTGAELVNLSEDEPVVVEEDVLGRMVDVRLSKRLVGKIDIGVSVPVMKAHAIHKISLGIKNLWGCEADTMRLLRRKHLPERLVLIARTLNVDFEVIDATIALDRYGPMEGDPVALDTIIAGDNLAATDAAGARLMGYDPRRLAIMRTAGRAGLGPIRPEAIDLESATPLLHKFRLERRKIDYLAIATFHNATLAKIVYDSRFTPWIYRAFGKVPGRKLS